MAHDLAYTGEGYMQTLSYYMTTLGAAYCCMYMNNIEVRQENEAFGRYYIIESMHTA